MRAIWLRRAAWIALGAVGLLVLGAAAGFATPLPVGPALSVGDANYSAGTVPVSLEVTPGVSAVEFEDGGGGVLATVTPVGSKASCDVLLHADMTIVAVGFDAGSNKLWRSEAPLALGDYVPGRPVLALADNALVGRRLTASGSAPGGTATSMALHVGGAVWWNGPVTVSGGSFVLPSVALPYGASDVTVVASNAFGHASSAAVTVYNLGTTLKLPSFILVDKSDFELYYVKNRCVTHVYPVAIGMPGTPTHTGTFKLAPWVHTPSAVWGPRRMALLKKVGKKYRPTSYYIHGTNAPWSIGMMASHGCVRLYSKDAIKLSRISRWFTVQIRR